MDFPLVSGTTTVIYKSPIAANEAQAHIVADKPKASMKGGKIFNMTKAKKLSRVTQNDTALARI